MVIHHKLAKETIIMIIVVLLSIWYNRNSNVMFQYKTKMGIYHCIFNGNRQVLNMLVLSIGDQSVLFMGQSVAIIQSNKRTRI